MGQFIGIETRENPAKGIAGGSAMGKSQEAIEIESVGLGMTILFRVLPAFSTADDGAKGDDEEDRTRDDGHWNALGL